MNKTLKIFCTGLLAMIVADEKYGQDYVFNEIVAVLEKHAGKTLEEV